MILISLPEIKSAPKPPVSASGMVKRMIKGAFKDWKEESEIALSQVAEFEQMSSFLSISREGQERYVDITAAIRKRDGKENDKGRF